MLCVRGGRHTALISTHNITLVARLAYKAGFVRQTGFNEACSYLLPIETCKLCLQN